MLPKGYKIVLDWFQEVAANGKGYENPEVVIKEVVPREEESEEEIRLEEAKAPEVKVWGLTSEERKGEEVEAKEAQAKEFKGEQTEIEESKVNEPKVEGLDIIGLKIKEVMIEEAKVKEQKAEVPKLQEPEVEESKFEESKVEASKAHIPKNEELSAKDLHIQASPWAEEMMHEDLKKYGLKLNDFQETLIKTDRAKEEQVEKKGAEEDETMQEPIEAATPDVEIVGRLKKRGLTIHPCSSGMNAGQ
jgi:hypothetical protein